MQVAYIFKFLPQDETKEQKLNSFTKYTSYCTLCISVLHEVYCTYTYRIGGIGRRFYDNRLTCKTSILFLSL